LAAVLWSSDLRGFTERSDRLAGNRMIAILNALFEAQAKAIHDHGGEILKFIGDGLLAISRSMIWGGVRMRLRALWTRREKHSMQCASLLTTRAWPASRR